jgi:hypothetical protein
MALQVTWNMLCPDAVHWLQLLLQQQVQHLLHSTSCH